MKIQNQNHEFLDCTQIPIPARTRTIPIHVSFAMTFRSTYHSPKTVKRNALLFARGTVRESSEVVSFISNGKMGVDG